jgi:hypothetical protein
VQTLYIGLGGGYFVNDTGDLAGVGRPGPKGWEWVNQPEIAARVLGAIKMYRNEQTARFVMLPASIQ